MGRPEAGNEQDTVELEPGPDVIGNQKMTQVDRVESSAKNTGAHQGSVHATKAVAGLLFESRGIVALGDFLKNGLGLFRLVCFLIAYTEPEPVRPVPLFSREFAGDVFVVDQCRFEFARFEVQVCYVEVLAGQLSFDISQGVLDLRLELGIGVEDEELFQDFSGFEGAGLVPGALRCGPEMAEPEFVSGLFLEPAVWKALQVEVVFGLGLDIVAFPEVGFGKIELGICGLAGAREVEDEECEFLFCFSEFPGFECCERLVKPLSRVIRPSQLGPLGTTDNEHS